MLVVILVLAIFVLASTAPVRMPAPITAATSTVPIAVSTVTLATSSPSAFHEVGTLVFYPNNVGPVPYLFYVDERGTVVSTALSFDALPSADFSNWIGARVDVTGTRVREHVVVGRIAYAAMP